MDEVVEAHRDDTDTEGDEDTEILKSIRLLYKNCCFCCVFLKTNSMKPDINVQNKNSRGGEL